MSPTLSSWSTAARASCRAADDHRFEARHAVHLGGQHPARVDHDQHLLAPLVFVLPRDRLAAAGGGLPIDDSGLIARHPLPEPLEQAAFPRPADRPKAGLPSAGNLQRQGAERRVRHRGVHGGGPRQLTVPCRQARPRGPSTRTASVPPCPTPRRAGSRSSRSSSPSPGGTTRWRLGVSAPPRGSGKRSRTSRVSRRRARWRQR